MAMDEDQRLSLIIDKAKDRCESIEEWLKWNVSPKPEKIRGLIESVDELITEVQEHYCICSSLQHQNYQLQRDNARKEVVIKRQNFHRHEMLIRQCQDDLTKIVSIAVRSASSSSSAKKSGD